MEEKQNQSSTIIGMGLIFLLLYMWMQYAAPKKSSDTPQNVSAADSAAQVLKPNAPPTRPVAAPTDSQAVAALNSRFGAFAPAAIGQETTETLENDFVRITFSSKGGWIKEVFLKQYNKINTDTANNEIKTTVRLLEDAKNRFEYLLPVQNAAGNVVNTGELFFTASKSGNSITFKADAGEGRSFEQTYSLAPDNYRVEYKVASNGLQNVLVPGQQLRLRWDNYLDKLEKNQEYERTYSTVYFKETDNKPDYCNCRENDVKDLGGNPVKWIAHSNQFFNTALIANDFAFNAVKSETQMFTATEYDLKLLKTEANIPFERGAASMTIYTGPNEFERLRDFGIQLEDIIPFGASLFGAINRWVIHPILDILSAIFSNKGVVILLLTLLVKLLVYPLTYRMVYSQARMSALKPQIDALRKKHGDDQQTLSMETMKLYSEFKVNPLGGCLPIFLQMPIWFALYRFFPAAIEFRQAGFLWATDLSSYDVAFKLPFYMPGFGTHISLFTLIWVATTLWYTWYSMKQMDAATMNSDQMKVMKYMQYLMPVMFMFFFNSFASGLTLYLCFSNILNIGQTVLTKKFLINHDKIKTELEANRNKPRKTGGFREKLEQAMKEQQRLQEERSKQQGKK
jgi:YidC/Oxa1 family membrane protein insertase